MHTCKYCGYQQTTMHQWHDKKSPFCSLACKIKWVFENTDYASHVSNSIKKEHEKSKKQA